MKKCLANISGEKFKNMTQQKLSDFRRSVWWGTIIVNCLIIKIIIISVLRYFWKRNLKLRCKLINFWRCDFVDIYLFDNIIRTLRQGEQNCMISFSFKTPIDTILIIFTAPQTRKTILNLLQIYGLNLL